MEHDETLDLLRRWHGGDQGALERLVERDLPWIRKLVSRRLGPLLRRRVETEDILQLTMVEVLRDGPRFVAGQAQFRALIARIVENVLRAEYDRHTAMRRDLRREKQLSGGGSVLDLSVFADSGTSPTGAAHRDEMSTLLRLAIELLPTEERSVVVLREFHGLSFPDIGERLGMPEKTAQRRFESALRQLVQCMDRLRRGRVEDAVPRET